MHRGYPLRNVHTSSNDDTDGQRYRYIPTNLPKRVSEELYCPTRITLISSKLSKSSKPRHTPRQLPKSHQSPNSNTSSHSSVSAPSASQYSIHYTSSSSNRCHSAEENLDFFSGKNHTNDSVSKNAKELDAASTVEMKKKCSPGKKPNSQTIAGYSHGTDEVSTAQPTQPTQQKSQSNSNCSGERFLVKFDSSKRHADKHSRNAKRSMCNETQHKQNDDNGMESEDLVDIDENDVDYNPPGVPKQVKAVHEPPITRRKDDIITDMSSYTCEKIVGKLGASFEEAFEALEQRKQPRSRGRPSKNALEKLRTNAKLYDDLLREMKTIRDHDKLPDTPPHRAANARCMSQLQRSGKDTSQRDNDIKTPGVLEPVPLSAGVDEKQMVNSSPFADRKKRKVRSSTGRKDTFIKKQKMADTNQEKEGIELLEKAMRLPMNKSLSDEAPIAVKKQHGKSSGSRNSKDNINLKKSENRELSKTAHIRGDGKAVKREYPSGASQNREEKDAFKSEQGKELGSIGRKGPLDMPKKDSTSRDEQQKRKAKHSRMRKRKSRTPERGDRDSGKKSAKADGEHEATNSQNGKKEQNRDEIGNVNPEGGIHLKDKSTEKAINQDETVKALREMNTTLQKEVSELKEKVKLGRTGQEGLQEIVKSLREHNDALRKEVADVKEKLKGDADHNDTERLNKQEKVVEIQEENESLRNDIRKLKDKLEAECERALELEAVFDMSLKPEEVASQAEFEKMQQKVEELEVDGVERQNEQARDEEEREVFLAEKAAASRGFLAQIKELQQNIESCNSRIGYICTGAGSYEEAISKGLAQIAEMDASIEKKDDIIFGLRKQVREYEITLRQLLMTNNILQSNSCEMRANRRSN